MFAPVLSQSPRKAYLLPTLQTCGHEPNRRLSSQGVRETDQSLCLFTSTARPGSVESPLHATPRRCARGPGQHGTGHGQHGTGHGQHGTGHGQHGTGHGQHGTGHGQHGTEHGQHGSHCRVQPGRAASAGSAHATHNTQSGRNASRPPPPSAPFPLDIPAGAAWPRAVEQTPGGVVGGGGARSHALPHKMRAATVRVGRAARSQGRYRPRLDEQTKIGSLKRINSIRVKQTEVSTHTTHVHGCAPAVYMRKTLVCFAYRIYSFFTFEFPCSCMRGGQ